MPSNLSVPGRNYHRDCAVRLGLTSETNQGSWLRCVDVAEFLDLFSFARGDIGEFICAAEYPHPAGTARGRAAFDGNRSFHAPWIDRAPIARMIVSGAPGQVLAFIQFVLCLVVIFVVRDGVLLVDCAQKTKQTLAVLFSAVAENLIRRSLCMFSVDANRARRAL